MLPKQLELQGNQLQELKDQLVEWFQLSKEARKQFQWQGLSQVNILIKFLPIIYPEINFYDLAVSFDQLYEISRKLVNGLRMKEVHFEEFVTFDINETFCFVFEGKGVGQVEKWDKNTVGSVNKTNAQFIRRVSTVPNTLPRFKKIIPLLHENWKRITIIGSHSPNLKLLISDNSHIERIKQDLIKSDTINKMNFINAYLFCGYSPPFTAKNIKVKRYSRNQTIKLCEDKVLLTYEGNIEMRILSKSNIKKFMLSHGSIVSEEQVMKLTELLEEDSVNESVEMKSVYENSDRQRVFSAQTNCLVLTMMIPEFFRCLKTEKNIGVIIQNKIQSLRINRINLVNKGQSAHRYIKSCQSKDLQMIYEIKGGNKNSKAFRKRKRLRSCEYEEFMTFDKYEKITENKEAVEKKHQMYNQINELIKAKKEQQRFIKTLKTEEGFKQIKRKQLSVRLKRSRIENLAVKAHIFDTSQYKNQINNIEFYFQGNNQQTIPHASTYKRWLSIQQVNEKSEKALCNSNKPSSISNEPNCFRIKQKEQPSKGNSVRFDVGSSKRCSISQIR